MPRRRPPERRAPGDREPVGEPGERGEGREAEADEQREPPGPGQVPLGHPGEGQDPEHGGGGVRADRRVGQRGMQWVSGESPDEIRESHGRSLPRLREATRRVAVRGDPGAGGSDVRGGRRRPPLPRRSCLDRGCARRDVVAARARLGGAAPARRPHPGERRVGAGRSARRGDLRRAADDRHARRPAKGRRAFAGRAGESGGASARGEPGAEAGGGHSARAPDRQHPRPLPELARARDDGDHLPLLRLGGLPLGPGLRGRGVREPDPGRRRAGRGHGACSGPRPAVPRDGGRAADRGGRHRARHPARRRPDLPGVRRPAPHTLRRCDLVPRRARLDPMGRDAARRRDPAGGGAARRRPDPRNRHRLRRLLPLRDATLAPRGALGRRVRHGGNDSRDADRRDRRADRRRGNSIAPRRRPRLLPRLRPRPRHDRRGRPRGLDHADPGDARDLRPPRLLARLRQGRPEGSLRVARARVARPLRFFAPGRTRDRAPLRRGCSSSARRVSPARSSPSA